MTFNEAALQQLLSDTDYPKLSIIMPTHGPSADGEQDPIRYERLVRAVLDDLSALGVDRRMSQELADELRSLTSPVGFWRSQLTGLAVFATHGSVWWYRLPIAVQELAVVGPDFQLVSLIRVARSPHFAVLAVSRAGARLFEGTLFELFELDLQDAPESLHDITQYYEQEKQLQFRQAATAGRGTQVAMFHGHGIGEGRDRELVLQYLRAVDKSVRRALQVKRVPLVVAGPSELPALFHQVSDYGAIVDQVELNPDRMDAAALHSKVLDVVKPSLEDPSLAALERYADLVGTGKTSDVITELVTAAAQGRVDVLLVGSPTPVWGTIDVESAKVEVHDSRLPGDRDLVNHTALSTIRNGGQVVWVGEDRLAAIAGLFRF